jgi:uncharacterized protein YegJ (DUF2314 family)
MTTAGHCICAAMIAVTTGLLNGCGRPAEPPNPYRPAEPDYTRSGDEEAALRQAMFEARNSYRQFVTALHQPGERRHGFSIKRGFRVGDDPEGEHLWLIDVTFDGGKFTGTVNNRPRQTTEVQFGERAEATPGQLSDWMYVEDGVLQGGYSIRAQLRNRTDSERERFEKGVGFKLDPPAREF